jgi:hypothetical protein
VVSVNEYAGRRRVAQDEGEFPPTASSQVVVPSAKISAPGKAVAAPYTYTFSRCAWSSVGIVSRAELKSFFVSLSLTLSLTLSSIFEKDTKQPVFFARTALPMVQELLDGYNSLLFTYGVTNSGKTFTVLVRPRHMLSFT